MWHRSYDKDCFEFSLQRVDLNVQIMRVELSVHLSLRERSVKSILQERKQYLKLHTFN